MKILLYTNNLMTRAQLADTWRRAGADIIRDEADAVPELIVIDLAEATALQRIQQARAKYPAIEILVFGPHVNGEAFRQAKVAGATSQVARGKVVERVMKRLQQ